MLEVELLQERYQAQTDREHRRAAGQFFTPRWVARGLARWVMAAGPRSILDPAFGFGILLDECRRQGYTGELIGYEIDRDIAKCWKEASDGEVQLHEMDFLASGHATIEAAIANPPYNRFQNRDLSPAIRLDMAKAVGELTNGFTNQYALFMYLVLSRLAENGRAAFIVPSEFLATGYGVQVKKFLLRSGRLRHLVIFDTSERVFAEAATTACVLLFDRSGCDRIGVWHLQGQADADRFLAICGEVQGTEAQTQIAYPDLEPSDNWQGLGQCQSDRRGFVDLGTFGSVKRGIATGANEYFVLRPSEAAARGLSEANLVACVASASAAPDIVFDENSWKALVDADKPAYLFDGFTAPSDAAADYVRHGESQLVHERYLTKQRRPWYRLERRTRAALLLAVFGRQGFRVALNHSQALNLTAFHGFYPRIEHERLTPLIWLYFQTQAANLSFAGRHRAYGDGLKKLEPGDWSKLHIPDWRLWDEDMLHDAMKTAQAALQAWTPRAGADWQVHVVRLDALIARYQGACVPGQRLRVGTDQLELV